MDPEPIYLGIDIGGTTTKIGLVTDSGHVLSQLTSPLPFDSGRETAIEALFDAVNRCLQQAGLSASQCQGIGVAAPGTLDLQAGVILHPFNVPDWKDLPLRDLVSQEFGLPAVLQNDANAAALGEYWCGTARDVESLMFWTLGTGIGGGIILNGRILSGAHSHAGECGHMILQMEGGPRSEFGIHGALELYAGARALVQRAERALNSGARSSLRSIRDERQLTAIAISDAALAGDELARRLVLETARYLAYGTVNIIHILNPEMVVIGGAMTFGQLESEIGREFLEQVRTTVKSIAFPIPAERTRIEFASLGKDAGFIGAAGCIRQHLRETAR